MTVVDDPTVTYVARRYMTIDGVKYERGASVPRDIIPPAKYRNWIENRILVLPIHAASLMKPAEPVDSTVDSGVAGNGGADRLPAEGNSAVEQTASAETGASEPPAVPKAMAEANGENASGVVAAAGEPVPIEIDGLPADNASGYLVESGRGWYNVHYGSSTFKVRTFEAAAGKLRELRGGGQSGSGKEGGAGGGLDGDASQGAGQGAI
jgi:hypothetical protein